MTGWFKRAGVLCIAFVVMGACKGGGGEDSDARDAGDPSIEDPGWDEDRDGEADLSAEEEAHGDPDAHETEGDAQELDGAGQDVDYISELLGYRDVESFMPGRPPTDCGPGCRQVSFADWDIWNESYDVWGDILVINTIYGLEKSVIWIDLATLTHYLVIKTDGSESQTPTVGWGSIYENNLVYQFATDNPPVDEVDSFLLFDVSTNFQSLIRTMVTAWNSSTNQPQIRMSHVVWWDNRTSEMGDGHYYVIDLTTHDEREISTEPCFVCDIDFSGRYAVFLGDEGGSRMIQLFAHDLETGETRRITSGDWDHVAPAVYGDTVVWTDLRNGGDYITLEHSDIYMMSLATGVETVVCDNPASVGGAAIWGGKVAWTDYRNDPEYPNVPAYATVCDIYMYDIATGLESQLTSNPGPKGAVKIYGDKLYYLMNDSLGVISVFEKVIE